MTFVLAHIYKDNDTLSVCIYIFSLACFLLPKIELCNSSHVTTHFKSLDSTWRSVLLKNQTNGPTIWARCTTVETIMDATIFWVYSMTLNSCGSIRESSRITHFPSFLLAHILGVFGLNASHQIHISKFMQIRLRRSNDSHASNTHSTIPLTVFFLLFFSLRFFSVFFMCFILSFSFASFRFSFLEVSRFLRFSAFESHTFISLSRAALYISSARMWSYQWNFFFFSLKYNPNDKSISVACHSCVEFFLLKFCVRIRNGRVLKFRAESKTNLFCNIIKATIIQMFDETRDRPDKYWYSYPEYNVQVDANNWSDGFVHHYISFCINRLTHWAEINAVLYSVYFFFATVYKYYDAKLITVYFISIQRCSRLMFNTSFCLLMYAYLLWIDVSDYDNHNLAHSWIH